MKHAHWFALTLVALFTACGGTTRIGSTREDPGSLESGGTSTDSGAPAGTGGASTGGRLGAGGRASGGRFGAGGRIMTGGVSFGGRGDGGVSFGGRSSGGVSFGGRDDGGFGTGGRDFDAGTDPLRNRVPAGHVCDRLTTIQCAGENHCCPSNRSLDACKQSMQTTCQMYIDVWSATPAVAYDIDRAEAAFNEFEKRASVCDTSIMAWALSDAGFRTVARGTVPLGESCLSIDAGVVSVDAIAQLGSCADPEINACLFTPPNRWVCAPRGAVGASCLTDMTCLDGLYCDTVSPMRCAARKPNGAPCIGPLGCESMNCGQNGTCIPATLETAYCLPY